MFSTVGVGRPVRTSILHVIDTLWCRAAELCSADWTKPGLCNTLNKRYNVREYIKYGILSPLPSVNHAPHIPKAPSDLIWRSVSMRSASIITGSCSSGCVVWLLSHHRGPAPAVAAPNTKTYSSTNSEKNQIREENISLTSSPRREDAPFAWQEQSTGQWSQLAPARAWSA